MMTRANIWAAAAAAAAAATLCAPVGAQAQESYAATPLNDLVFRIDRLEEMARQSGFGDQTAAQRLAAVAASVRALEDNSRDGEFTQRLARVESELDALTAWRRRESARINVMSAELGALRADVVNLESRIAALERRAAGPMRGSLQSPRALTPPPQLVGPSVAAGVTPLDAPVILDHAPAAIPRLPSPPMVEIDPPPQPQADFGRSENDAADRAAWQIYDQALAKLQQSDAASAQLLFEEIDTGGEYAGRALFWIGEIRYQARDYSAAASAYQRSYEGYPNGEKSADSLLGLGLSLAAQPELKDEACAVFRQAQATFRASNASAAQRAYEDAQTFGCPPA